MDGVVQTTTKDPIEGRAALVLLDGVRRLHVAKGRKVLSFELPAQRPADEELLELMLGRSGKLRAPTLRIGDQLLVGYNAELFEATLK